jgi:NAD(P)H-dependent nitrite reductase small subunit
MEIYPNDDFPTIERDGKTFVEICASEDVLRRKGTRVEFDEELQIAVFRIGERLLAVSNICPHQHNPSLHEGEINAEDCTITCPLHGWSYSLESGKSTTTSHSHVTTYTVFEEHGFVYLEKPEPIEPAWSLTI